MTNQSSVLRASWRSWVVNDLRQPAGPYWMQWLWTTVFAAALAAGFTLLGFVVSLAQGRSLDLSSWAVWYGRNLVVCLVISVIIHLLFEACRLTWATPQRIESWSGWQRALFFTGIPMLGVALGWPIGLWLAGADVVQWFTSEAGSRILLTGLASSVVLTVVMYVFFSAKARQYELERRATEAQLRLLQAQIEPHFLFNTLANVQSLMAHDLPRAQQMLADFTDYLRASLGALRRDSAPLAKELELARSYLQLIQGRMADRLSFAITADPDALSQPVPPLLLQPLVENAVVHGLEPAVDGGHLDLRARIDGDRLVVEVQDNGLGLDGRRPRRDAHASAGTGMALANIRERLMTRYGGRARLDLHPAEPGTLARITLPLDARPTGA